MEGNSAAGRRRLPPPPAPAGADGRFDVPAEPFQPRLRITQQFVVTQIEKKFQPLARVGIREPTTQADFGLRPFVTDEHVVADRAHAGIGIMEPAEELFIRDERLAPTRDRDERARRTSAAGSARSGTMAARSFTYGWIVSRTAAARAPGSDDRRPAATSSRNRGASSGRLAGTGPEPVPGSRAGRRPAHWPRPVSSARPALSSRRRRSEENRAAARSHWPPRADRVHRHRE